MCCFALEIVWDVWWCYGDSVGRLTLLWRFSDMFFVVTEILWDVWFCCGDSLGCLLLLWGFCQIFGISMDIGMFIALEIGGAMGIFSTFKVLMELLFDVL
jgi:hypothetical protein